ncbi:MAG: YqhA family protein [Proteobacteria bacterium]|nr:YqhA family protein [Pseudomonadota bacterium]
MERLLRLLVLGTRWVLAPIYLGMFGSLFVVAAKFIQEFVTIAPRVLDLPVADTILFVLSLVDLALVANLILMVLAGGMGYFLPDNSDIPRPSWFGNAEPGSIKLRLMAAIVAISAIEVLKAFLHLEDFTDRVLTWTVGILLAFVASAILLALSDRLEGKGEAAGR